MADEIKTDENTPSQAEIEESLPNKKEEAVSIKKMKNSIEAIEKSIIGEHHNAEKYPAFAVGDTIKVFVKIIEGEKQRIQPYEGVVLAIRHGRTRKSFIVRRISYGVAIERVFPFYSPYIEKIELVRKGRVRRAKIYYLRGRFGKSAVITEKV